MACKYESKVWDSGWCSVTCMYCTYTQKRVCKHNKRNDRNESAAKYRKKPVVVEAVQWTGQNTTDIIAFAKGWVMPHENNTLSVLTLEGEMFVSVGDYIIKGVNGEFYPCRPDIFEKTYERVEEDA